MLYKQLGRTGLKVSQLCFGTMSFGGDANEQQSARMFNACLDAGINFFDCADVYSKGVAETILGKLMRETRDELVITSKCFVPMGSDVPFSLSHKRRQCRWWQSAAHPARSGGELEAAGYRPAGRILHAPLGPGGTVGRNASRA